MASSSSLFEDDVPSSVAPSDVLAESIDTTDPIEEETERREEELGEDEEFVTAAEVLADMRVAWVNETASKYLLPHYFDNVDCLQEQVHRIEEGVSDPRNRTKHSTSMHEMEVARVQYMLNDYMRRRLQKIESNPRGVLVQHNERVQKGDKALLCDREIRFASRFSAGETKYYQSAFLSKLPSSLQKMPILQQNMEHERVFVQVTADDVEDVSINDLVDPTQEIVVSLPKGSIHCIPLMAIKEHLENDKMILF